MRRATILVGVVVLMSISGGSGGGTIAPFDPVVVVTSSSVLGSGGGDDWWGRASIKRRPSDSALVMIYRRGTAHDVNDGDLHIKFSNDHGATWTAEDTKLGGGAVTGFPMNPPVSAGQDAGEPWLMVAPNGDLLIHMWRIDYSVSMGGSYQSRSTDGGATWSAPAVIDFVGETDDTIIFSTDDDFVYERVIYAGARIYSGGADGTPSSMILIKSPDNGATWTKVSTIMAANEGSAGTGGQEVGLEYLGNSTIIAMLRDNAHTNSYQRMSTDMGLTWGSLTTVTSTVGIAARQRVYTRSHLLGVAGWWKDPLLFMVGFVHQTSGQSLDRRNAVWISPDRGATWDGPHYIDTLDDDGGYGDLFYDFTNARWVVVSYKGTLAAASLKQYNLTITGL